MAEARAITSAAGLVKAGLAEAGSEATLAKVGETFTIRLTPEVQRQIGGKRDGAVGRQYVPSANELNIRSDETADPTGDLTHQKVKGLIHRYPDRVLLLPTQTCAVYCRFCFRREKVGQGAGLNTAELEAAYAYIAAHREIFEVILSGGDPLVLSDRRLAAIIQRLSAIPHVQAIRIHTRVPVAEPSRIAPSLIKALKSKTAVHVVLHVNHRDELTQPVRRAIARLAKAGIPLHSQSVLLRGVNDSATALEQLFRALVANRVTPYYLHHLDHAQGTSHFRVPIAEGQNIMRQLRGRLTGLAVPTYVVDIEGGHGKVPLTPQYHAQNEIADPWGRRHQIKD